MREVESEYIREEILDGFDVSTVFVKCEAEPSAAEQYYEFKAEIDSKEKIREVVGAESAAVIEQLERWWDKYRVSLKELDMQLAEAEEVMKGFLQELGYA